MQEQLDRSIKLGLKKLNSHVNEQTQKQLKELEEFKTHIEGLTGGSYRKFADFNKRLKIVTLTAQNLEESMLSLDSLLRRDFKKIRDRIREVEQKANTGEFMP